MDNNLTSVAGIDDTLASKLNDLGYSDLESLIGQNPKAICDHLFRDNARAAKTSLPVLQKAVYLAETPDPDPRKLTVSYWYSC